ncbi:MAG: TlpA disulfide reductase family protein [Flavobacteriales bacterium]|nr:TlpA disulfide reductase family protein [Flavobacteriales bacterium]
MKKILTVTMMCVASFFMMACAQKKTNDQAYNFNFSSVEQKDYTMESFFGKVVLIDVWATWCPPCRAEIPSMQALEKSYEGKDIAFVSISVDKDKSAWDAFQKANTMTGIQLYADADGVQDFMSYYGIRSIPRFILVGKDGKVISKDAPRPSTNELKILIDQALKN